jgi:hypothetical protein
VQHIEDAVNLPWNSAVLSARYSELPTDVDIIVVCASGGRSDLAASFLDGQGFTNIYDMLGGMSAWVWEKESCDSAPIVRAYDDGSDMWVNWTPTAGAQDYDLLRGQVEKLSDELTFVDLGPTSCLADDSVYTYWADQDIPDAGSVYFYLARQRDDTWGESSQHQERLSSSHSCD